MPAEQKINEPAIDLSVCCAIASSIQDKTVDNNIVVVGEVGLGGEIRSVGNIEKRIQEGEKLGFKKIIIPQNNYRNLKLTGKIKIIPVENLSEVVNLILK